MARTLPWTLAAIVTCCRGVSHAPAIAERWRAVEHDFREYLAGLHEEALIQSLTYVGLSGEIWIYPLWRALLHLVNHQTDHRGQVSTVLRQLGVTPPPPWIF
jgi:uncharacterized damage-inducible protein DinB